MIPSAAPSTSNYARDTVLGGGDLDTRERVVKRILLTLLSVICAGILSVAGNFQSSPVTPTAFGMHEHNLAVNGWPKVPFGSFRIVGDQVPNVTWADIEPSRGDYDWSKLDALINRITPHNVDIVYTFRKVPRWASSRPKDFCDNGD